MRRETKKYYFSVEGEMEGWYLQWLQNTINRVETRRYNAKFDVKVEKNPMSRIKSLTVSDKTEITHVFDMEGQEDVFQKQFCSVLSQMKEAESLGKKIKYYLGYSNLTFDLWMILHKMDYNAEKSHRKQYLDDINKAYHEKFEGMNKYKEEANFKKRILATLSFEDVKKAIERANGIMKKKERDYNPREYKGYEYYRENPALNLGKVFEKILKDCGLDSTVES